MDFLLVAKFEACPVLKWPPCRDFFVWVIGAFSDGIVWAFDFEFVHRDRLCGVVFDFFDALKSIIVDLYKSKVWGHERNARAASFHWVCVIFSLLLPRRATKVSKLAKTWGKCPGGVVPSCVCHFFSPRAERRCPFFLCLQFFLSLHWERCKTMVDMYFMFRAHKTLELILRISRDLLHSCFILIPKRN